MSADGIQAYLGDNKTIKIRLKNSTSGTAASIYFATYDDTVWNEQKRKTFNITANDANYTEYTIDMSAVDTWEGDLKQLRLDVVDNAASGSFSLDYIRILP